MLNEERYLMCKSQPVQLDCRVEECKYYKLGACKNEAPAITIYKDKFVCWTCEKE